MLRPHILASLGVLLCSAVASAQKDKEVELADFKVKFTIPAGWKVLKTEKKKDTALVVMQETQVAKGAKTKALIGIWLGKKYITDAPAQGEVNAGKDLAGAVWASRRALAWAAGTPEKLLPYQGGDLDVGLNLMDKRFVSAQYKTKTLAVYAVGSEKREGGELTAAAISDPDAIERVKKVLDGLIGKEK